MSISILDPTKLTLNILGCKVEGFSRGSFVTINKESPTFQMKTSIKGTKLANRNKCSDYVLTFRMENTAASNTWLHAICKLQEMYGAVFPVPVIYKDENGETNFYCMSGLIEEPRVDQGNEVTPTEWRVICPKTMNTIGGSSKDATISKILQTVATFLSIADFAGLDTSGLRRQAENIIDKAASTIGGMF